MTLEQWKLKQIDLANKRLAHYWELIQSMESEGKDPADPVFDYLAGLSWLETYRLEIMLYTDHRFYFSSDHNLEKN